MLFYIYTHHNNERILTREVITNDSESAMNQTRRKKKASFICERSDIDSLTERKDTQEACIKYKKY